MPPVVYRSIARQALIVLSCTVILGSLALAQHVIAHPVGGEVHISAPPAPHIAISPAPILRSPISTPRMPVVSYSGGAVGAIAFRPPHRPIRPFPPVFYVYEFPYLGAAYWGMNSCWWTTCDYFFPWTLGYNTITMPGPVSYITQVYETPVVYGDERPDLPQLLLKDGTILSVTDYWVVDEQLHFTMIEQEGGKPVEHVIPFDALDLQKTIEVNTRRGFRFMLRNEPVDQFIRDHPEGSPAVLTPPQQ